MGFLVFQFQNMMDICAQQVGSFFTSVVFIINHVYSVKWNNSKTNDKKYYKLTFEVIDEY